MSITPERQRQIEQLYRAVLDREIARRHEFLIESSVGDEGLRRAVEAMLDHGSPFVVPADETEGVAPGNPNVATDCKVATGLTWLLEGLSVNAFRLCLTPAI